MANWAELVRPSLLGLEPYRPGPSVSELKREHGLDELYKLNWNEDLFGTLPGATEAVAAELERVWMYPEQAYSDLRQAVASWAGVGAEQIVPGHGIQALISTVAHVFVREGDRVVVPQPTYGLYAQVCSALGAEIVRVPPTGLRLDLERSAEAARETDARLVWLCDPNNPTGSLVERREWESLLTGIPGTTVVVVDEAYREYADPARLVAREPDVTGGGRIVLLRTFSKIFGIAGLRLGYAVAAEQLAAFMDVVQEPFNVNRAALAAGRALVEHPQAVAERRATSKAARDLLSRLLAEAGMEPVPSEANFVLVGIGVDDSAAAEALLGRGFLVRPGSEFGLHGYLRITVGPPPLMERFAAELVNVRDALLAAKTLG
jgi:histidinol-phosphate aminotransferase